MYKAYTLEHGLGPHICHMLSTLLSLSSCFKLLWHMFLEWLFCGDQFTYLLPVLIIFQWPNVCLCVHVWHSVWESYLKLLLNCRDQSTIFKQILWMGYLAKQSMHLSERWASALHSGVIHGKRQLPGGPESKLLRVCVTCHLSVHLVGFLE